MKVLFVVGTRPEVIKTAPVVRALRDAPDRFQVQLCVTGQQRELLEQTLAFFELRPEYDLRAMSHDQSLADVASRSLAGLRDVLAEARPDHVVVQGDTTATFAGALAAFYARTPVSHIEAGLRTANKRSPFPEEMHRVLTSQLADYHFAPTESARAHLESEGITRNVWVVGNTVIDALNETLTRVRQRSGVFEASFDGVDLARKLVLVTTHRRENIGDPMDAVGLALRDVATSRSDTELVCPVHPNPRVAERVQRALDGVPNVHLVAPLDYPHFVWLLDRCHAVVTDSGGVQEEAAALRKSTLVLRDVTERMEGVAGGTSRLVGTERLNVARELTRVLDQPAEVTQGIPSSSPFGDGASSGRIRDVLATLADAR